jgi:putative proteasome-type protease
VRAYDADMSFEDAVKLLMLSFDSTIKANLSVGLPLDLHLYETDSFRHGIDPPDRAGRRVFEMISSGWGEALKDAFNRLPPYTIG